MYRLLGGVPQWRIHTRDTAKVLGLVTQGLAAGALLATVISLARSSVGFLGLEWHRLAVAALIAIAITGVAVALMSLLARPAVTLIAQRRLPLPGYRKASTALTALVIFFAALVVPFTAQSWVQTKALADDYAQWQNLSEVVRISLPPYDQRLYEPDGLQSVTDVLTRAQEQGIVLTSYVLDKSVGFSKQDLSGFDHVIITDQAWLDMTTSQDSPAHAKLRPLDAESIPAALKQLLDGQLPLLLAPGVAPRYFTVASGKLLAMSPNIGLANNTVQTNNSLIVVIDDAASAFKTSGFTLPALSTGNIVFSDVTKLKAILSGTLVGDNVIGFESIADLALGQSQKFAAEASYYLAACVMLLIAIGFGAAHRAMLWANENQRRIFAEHTYGVPYTAISKPQIKREMTTLGITILVGGALSFLLRQPELGYLLGSAAIIAIIYIITTRFALSASTRRAFASVVYRFE